MSFIDAAMSNERDMSKNILTATTGTTIRIKDGKRLIAKRLLKGFSELHSFQEAFKSEFEIGKRLNHPNILPYEEYVKEEDGQFYIRMAGIQCVPFDYYLKENPAFIAQTKEIDRIIGEIMDAVAYMHQEGVLHLDLRPSNLLLTKTQKSIQVINPASTYLHCKPSIAIGDKTFTAPEIIEQINEGDERSDIYSIGKIIEYIFTYADVPLTYRRVVKKATQANPAKRYKSVQEMKKAIKQASFWVTTGKKMLFIAILLAFVFIFWWGLMPNHTEEPPISPIQLDELPEGTMLNDEGFVVPDTSLNNSLELTPEQLEKQKAYQEQVEKIFKKNFAKKADAELSKLYDSNSMNGDLADFKALSIKSMSTLDEYQKELCEKYEIDPITGAKLASEVITTITQQKLKELEEKKKEEE